MLPLLAAALIADFTAQLVSKERLYHGLSLRFGTTQVQHESDEAGNGSVPRA